MKKIIKLLIVSFIVLCSTFTGRIINAEITYPVKGDHIKILVDNSEYRVAKQTSDGDHTYLLSSFSLGGKMKYSNNSKNDYEGSVIQSYTNGILENLDSKIKDALVEQTNLKQYSYTSETGNPNGETEFSGQKFVFPLDIKDLNDYAAGTSGSGNISKKMNELFFKEPVTSRTFIWLMSKYKTYSDCAAFYDTTNRIQLDSHTSVSNSNQNAHHAFVADLDKLTAKITFDSKGGSEVDEQKVSLWTVNGAAASNYATKPTDPTRTGYTFKYWYLDNENTEYDFTTPVTDDITLNAKWEANKYTVTFNPDGGSVNPTSKEVTFDSAYGDLPTPTKTGSDFEGWYDSEENKILSSTTVSIADNHTLKAKYTTLKYKVTFMHNGEEFDVQEIEYNGKASEPADELETTGMQVFDGWYKGNEPFDFNTLITEAITLTSKINEYTYEYVGDTKTWTKGGSGSLTLTFKRMYNGDVMNTDGDDTIGTHAKFESFEVEGSTLDTSNYTYSKGSVNVDLKDSYLNTLSEGAYNCKAKFSDGGEASASFIVKEKSTPTPKPTPTPSQNVTPRVVPNTSAR